MRMLKGSDGAGFLPKSFDGFLGKRRMEDLDSGLRKFEVNRLPQIDRHLASAPQQLEEAIIAELLEALIRHEHRSSLHASRDNANGDKWQTRYEMITFCALVLSTHSLKAVVNQ